MQIYEKYKNDYAKSLELLKLERNCFNNKLSQIEGIRIIPSQANYVMVELTNNMTSKEFTKIMLLKYNCLVKDLSKKTNGKQFLRFSIRNSKDNNKLIDAIKEIME
jgi:histidinol-phosphate/aromatic aminotransferase/cobyric acid decarboxylase-like protein